MSFLLNSFLSWKGIIWTFAILGIIGYTIDRLLIKYEEKKFLLSSLRKFEDKLARIPINEWQINISKWIILF